MSAIVLLSSSSALPVVAVASSDEFFPSTVATAFTTSFSFGSLPSGTFTVQFPSPSAFVSTFVPSGSSTTTFAFGSALPLISLSPAFTGLIFGFAVASVGVVSVTVTGTVTSTSSPFGNVTVTTASVSPAFDTSGSVFTTTFDPSGRFVIFSLY